MNNNVISGDMASPAAQKQQRNSAIDLLKILAMIGVIILHYNNVAIGKAFTHAPLYSAQSYVIYFLQAVSINAVDVFVLISGYFMCKNKTINLKKPVRLIIQVIVFRELIVLIKMLAAGVEITAAKMLPFLLPTNWFAMTYVCLYCLSPFINKLLRGLSKKDFKLLVVMCFLLLSVWPWCVDVIQKLSKQTFNGLSTLGMYGSQDGYTIVNFVLVYIIGAYIRLMEEQYSTEKCAFGLACCWLGIFAFSYYLQANGFDSYLAYEYCSPVVILSAVFVFLIFRNFKMRNNPLISSLAKSTFAVYLLNPTILADVVKTKEYVEGPVSGMLGHIAVTCVAICAVSWGLQLIFDWIANLIGKAVNKDDSADSKIYIQ